MTAATDPSTDRRADAGDRSTESVAPPAADRAFSFTDAGRPVSGLRLAYSP